MFYVKHERVRTPVGEESLTKQSETEKTEIDYILKQYGRTGVISHMNPQPGRFEYLPDPTDYQQALEAVREAEQQFAQLPATVRDRYGNEPARFLAAFNDEAELAFMREAGLINPEPVPPPAPQSAAPKAE